MQKTNSYSKYYEIIRIIDQRNEPVSAYELAEMLNMSSKQIIRCIAEIAAVNDHYELSKVGRATAVQKIKEHYDTNGKNTSLR